MNVTVCRSTLRSFLVLEALCAAALFGCGEGSDALDTQSAAQTLSGDWFQCMDETCDKLTLTGMRFQDDGTWIALEAEPQFLEPDELYCAFESSPHQYRWSGAQLEIQGRYNAQFLTWTPERSDDGSQITLWIGPAPVTPDQGLRQVKYWKRLASDARAYTCVD